MTNRPAKTLVWLAVAASLAVTGCKKEDEPEPNEGELITTVALSLTKAGSTTPVTITFKDIDGPGGAAATLTPATLILDANATYTTKVRFLNESVTPAKDITQEVEAKEPNEHEVFYRASGASLALTNFNTDKNTPPLKLGTTATATTAAASTGSLTVTLKHKPEDDAATRKVANDPVSKGETDSEVVFPVSIR